MLPHLILTALSSVAASPAPRPTCLRLPSDPDWPGPRAWSQLNRTLSGRLLPGLPLGQPCHAPDANPTRCALVRNQWTNLEPFLDDPVNIMSPYWNNNTCSPFASTAAAPCRQGNLASYAVNATSAADVVAAVRFARAHALRLVVKNTGHDFLGRSAGAGALALWTHHLRSVTFLEHSSIPAVRLGAGVSYADVLPLLAARGRRLVGGACPTVGLVGGFAQGGGHGPLLAAHGLAADQLLAWEVVTAAGEHLTVTADADDERHADLFWALSGGGAGNYAVVLSATFRTHRDGPVAGAALSFSNRNDTAFWAAVSAWLGHLLALESAGGGGITTVSALTSRSFALEFATAPDVSSVAVVRAALEPFLGALARLGIVLDRDSYRVDTQPDFYAHYRRWVVPATQYTANLTVGGRLVPRAVVRDASSRASVVAALRDITRDGAVIVSVAGNVANSSSPSGSAVLPAWREALFTAAFADPLARDADDDRLRHDQAQLNSWQERLRAATGDDGGAYMNEATWDNPHWKRDYFGSNYEKLLAVKNKYDPDHVFWANAAVGSDLYWKAAADHRLCRVSK